ncbi:hypothetical protein [Ensifer sp. SL37]|uniref:hypothetical protein n=1 Tax=Ensifer sp. SL37 TaxID=2995137 RepID=UPI0022750C08|nr:hypothetical protein [Ensifer sp. SL37]MCY1740886.1 hypothetical protein [Ensifer sp. SL37]
MPGRPLLPPPDGYLELGREFEIHVGRPAALVEMFTRGELDAAARPLFHYESAPDLVIELPLAFVRCADWSKAGKRDEPLPVILETSQSPYSYYAKRLLSPRRRGAQRRRLLHVFVL